MRPKKLTGGVDVEGDGAGKRVSGGESGREVVAAVEGIKKDRLFLG